MIDSAPIQSSEDAAAPATIPAPRVLIIETSGRQTLLGLSLPSTEDPAVRTLHTQDLPQGRRHNIHLAHGIQRLLAEHRWAPADLDAVAVSLGPGAFTGLRVGITTAKMFVWGIDADVKLIGIPTIEAIAMTVANDPSAIASPSGRFAVAMNVKRDTVYAGQFVRNPETAKTPRSPEAVSNHLAAPAIQALSEVVAWEVPVFAGDAKIEAALQEAGAASAGVTERPSLAALDQIARERFQGGRFTPPDRLRPFYAREPEAVTLWRQRYGDEGNRST